MQAPGIRIFGWLLLDLLQRAHMRQCVYLLPSTPSLQCPATVLCWLAYSTPAPGGAPIPTGAPPGLRSDTQYRFSKRTHFT